MLKVVVLKNNKTTLRSIYLCAERVGAIERSEIVHLALSINSMIVRSLICSSIQLSLLYSEPSGGAGCTRPTFFNTAWFET